MLGLSGGYAPARQENEEEDLYEWSPFTGQGEDSQGYIATSTLAGTRIKTSLRDVGSAVSVLIMEIFGDAGATDAATVLSYATNTEVSDPSVAGAMGRINYNSANNQGRA